MEKKLTLTDLIDVKILQKIQDGFSEYSKLASITTDETGSPVTVGSGFSHFCMDLTRKTKKGFQRCINCDRQGALQTAKNGKVTVYTCHAGLVDYAAPIIADGKIIGNFIGGQVLTDELDEKKIRKTARELDIDEEEYLAAARQIPRKDRKEVERIAEFLGVVANILSEMAYNNRETIRKNRELASIANSQTRFIIRRNLELREKVRNWIAGISKIAVDEKSSKYKDLFGSVVHEGNLLINSLEETAEFVRLTDGKLGFQEAVYNIEDMCNLMIENVVTEFGNNGNTFEIKFIKNCKKEFYGDAGYIGKIIMRLVKNALRFTINGIIKIEIGSEKKGYATILTLKISDTGSGMPKERLERVRGYIWQTSYDRTIPNNFSSQQDAEVEFDLSMVGVLVRQIKGTISVESEEGKGTIFTIKLPQLQTENFQMGV